MRSYPTIRQGLGKLTPELWQRLMKMLQSYESTYPRDERQPQVRQPGTVMFLARITASQVITTNRWKYEWEEVEMVDSSFDALSGGRSGTFSDGFALNTLESDNTADVVAPGVDVSAAGSYPSGFSPQSICEQVTPVVIMFKISGGDTDYVFSVANAHDGDCV